MFNWQKSFKIWIKYDDEIIVQGGFVKVLKCSLGDPH